MLGIIVATTLIALLLKLILKKVHLPTIIGYILTGTTIAYIFNLFIMHLFVPFKPLFIS